MLLTPGSLSSAVPVVIFSDFTCPFSHVAEAALRRRAAAGEVTVEYRAFELYPVPAPLPEMPDAAAGSDAVQRLAEAVGVRLGAPGFVPRTRKAHEAARFAAEHGVGPELREAIFDAYWGDGRDIGRIDVLVELGVALGLDRSELKVELDVDRYTAAVERDEAEARRLGLGATPALIVGSGADIELVVGALPEAELDELLRSQKSEARSQKNDAPDLRPAPPNPES
ncbi:MAG TPA: DsbA family protein [Longimicrobiaceae bacterium]|nr:DsbA family protein [Longimicrobiaceae bacterium]